MNTSLLQPQLHTEMPQASLQHDVDGLIDGLFASLPDPQLLTAQQRTAIIARYTSVLEGNFIYWMTAALIAARSEEARSILIDNLYEEVRDAHPIMLRKFAVAAHAYPTDTDSLAVDADLAKVRRFLGKLSAVQSIVTMAFFEGFIQKFMAYLADLAVAQGSTELEYTDVHGVCDVEHTAGLFRALSLEMAVNPLPPDKDPLEGVYLLRSLIQTIVRN